MTVADTAFEVGICHGFNALVWTMFTRFVYLQENVEVMIRKLLVAAAMLLSYITVATAQTGTWSGKLDIQGTKLTLVFHLDDENPTMDSPDQGVKGIPMQIERDSMGKITVKIPSLGASYEGTWMIRQIVGSFRQMNVEFPLTLTPGENKPKRPQTPVGPFPYTTEEVTFANGDVVLHGTLTLPEGHTAQTPALIMITGSGIQNRDEELFEHKPFAVIADALARAGIATLRYDDRGFNGYDGNLNDCTIEDFMADALAGLELLRSRFSHVGVIGHSEGGTIAMMLAAEKQVDFAISLAGMIVSGAETLVEQNRIVLTDAGLSEETVDEYCILISEAFNACVNGKPLPSADNSDLPEALKRNYQAVIAQLQTPYLSRFIAVDVRPLLPQITCPVLALNGTKDIQVNYETNLEALRNGLNGTASVTIRPVEGVNHIFQTCTTGRVEEYKEIEETISPSVLSDITTWISNLK
jgi:pimeloyl-ACP methyl ester carboxylesterase